uniref:VWFA domain-containing protein n=1 Tax=Ciona intestinalis TaxID=7719 RepID=H2XPS3_CIOIN
SALDVAFLIDSSADVSYSSLRHFKVGTKHSYKQFTVGSQFTRVGMMQYGDEPHTEFDLNTFQQKNGSQVFEAISNVTQIGGESGPYAAILQVLRRSLTAQYGSRENVSQIIIFVTDGGVVDDSEESQTILNELRFSGALVYTIGVGRMVSRPQLRMIASRPASHHVTTIASYSELSATKSQIIDRICRHLHPKAPSVLIDLQFLIHTSIPEHEGGDIDTTRFLATMTNVFTAAFVKQVVDSFFIGIHYTRVSIIVYSGTCSLEFSFEEYLRKGELLEYINNMTSFVQDEPANAGFALNFTLKHILNSLRVDAQPVVVHLTDSGSTDDVTRIGNEFRALKIPVFSIGIGSGIDQVELSSIATSSQNVMIVNSDITLLPSQASELVTRISRAAKTECENIELDVQFLLDGSTSINSANFAKVKDWVKSLTSTFEIGYYTTRVGINQYSDHPNVEFTMADYFTKTSILGAIDDIVYKKGRTSIGEAINFTRVNSFTPAAGARSFVKKVLLVMTDGVSQDSIQEASALMHNIFQLLSKVGVGEVSLPQLQTIASDPDTKYVYKVSNFDAINSIRGSLVTKICGEGRKRNRIPEMDLVVLLDSSIGARDNAFGNTKKFLKELASSFAVGPYNSLFSVIQFDNSTNINFNLLQHNSSLTLVQAIADLSPEYDVAGEPPCLLGSALTEVREQLLNNNFGPRPNVPKVVLVITASNSMDDLTYPATELMHDGTMLFSICVGIKVNRTQIQKIVTAPYSSFFYSVSHFRELPKIEKSLSRGICAAIAPECRMRAVDVIFLIDGSSSVTNADFTAVKLLMVNLTDSFDIGPEGARVGLVQYGNEPTVEFDLRDFDNREDLRESIMSLEHCTGNTFTAKAIKFVTNYAFSTERGGRPNVLKVALLITDGRAQDYRNIRSEAEQAHTEGIKIFGIGVGEAQLSELEDMSSLPTSQHTMFVQNYQDIEKLRSRLVHRICQGKRC